MKEAFWIEWRYADERNDWARFESREYPTRVEAALRLEHLQSDERIRIANARIFRVAEFP